MGADCGICPLNGSKKVLPTVNEEAKVIILGESPGYQEEKEGRPFVGPSGKLLDRALRFAKIDRERDTHITNAILCRPKKGMNPKEWKKALTCCRERLFNELEDVGTNYIIGLGAYALKTIANRATIFPWVGAPLVGEPWEVQTKRSRKERHPGALVNFNEYTILPTLHPAFCLRSPGYIPVMRTHIARAWMLANKTLAPWEWPPIFVDVGQEMTMALQSILEEKLPIGVDVETQGVDPLTSKLMCLGIANKNRAVSIPWESYASKSLMIKGIHQYEAYSNYIKTLVERILRSDIPKIMQNGQHDALTIKYRIGIDITESYDYDTLLAHAVVAPRLRHDLGFIAACEVHAERWKTNFKVTSDVKGLAVFVERKEEDLRTYNAKDSAILPILQEHLDWHLAKTHRGQEELDKKLALMKVAMFMKERGIQVDTKKQAEHRTYLREKRDKAFQTIRKVSGNPRINPNSVAQLRALFYKKLKEVPIKYTDKGRAASVDEETLKSFCTSSNPQARETALALLEYRKQNKLLSTYIENLPLDHAHVVHPDWKVYGTRTGRWSASPGLMTIPKPVYNKEGELIARGLRDMFIARKGSWIVKADYSQLELRIIALLAGDKILLDAYASGKDVHTENAKGIFQTEAPTKAERNLAKIFVYATNYGGKASEIWANLSLTYPSLTLRQVETIYTRWFKIHWWIKKWQQEQIKLSRKNLYVECPLSGRRQYYLDGIINANEVLNFPVQGTGSDIIDPALLEIAAKLDWKRFGILLQVHDEIVIEGPAPQKMFKLMKKHMERTIEYDGHKMTFPVDVSIGKSWADTTEVATLKEVKELTK